MHFQSKQLLFYIQASLLCYFIESTNASPSTNTVEIKCTYEDQNWSILSIGIIYECECKEMVKVTQRNTVVSNVTGMHIEHANNSHVEGVHIIGASYLPKGIETFFPNLIGISLEQHLKEITQSDLKPFPKLQHFWAARNRLEVIEKDLFQYNPELTYISLKFNFIKEIDPNVFDNLQSLRILELGRNDCIDDNAVGKFEIQKLIEQLQGVCAAGQIFPETDSEKLNDENRILNEELVFWKNFTIVLLSLVVLAIGIGVFILIKKYGVNGAVKFIPFRNS